MSFESKNYINLNGSEKKTMKLKLFYQNISEKYR